MALAERADQPAEYYGLGRRSIGPVAIAVVRGRGGFDSVSRGRIPSWGAGLALPAARFIAIRADAGDPFDILRHELAHLALRQAVKGRVPLWFDEGYAAVSAGEFGRLESLELNLSLALGRVPSLDALDAGLRGAEATATTAYALAATAVLDLARRNPTGTLTPLLARLGAAVPFDSAVVLTTGLRIEGFEEAWQKDVKRRYSLGLWLLGGGLWAVAGLLVVIAARMRRRREAPRRAALDAGWVVPPGEDEPAAQLETPVARPLDRDRPPS